MDLTLRRRVTYGAGRRGGEAATQQKERDGGVRGTAAARELGIRGVRGTATREGRESRQQQERDGE